MRKIIHGSKLREEYKEQKSNLKEMAGLRPAISFY